MRVTALLIAAAVAVAMATPADAARKRATKPDPNKAAMAVNDASYRLVRDSLPVWLPGWAQAIYFSDPKNKAAYGGKPEPKKKKRMARR